MAAQKTNECRSRLDKKNRVAVDRFEAELLKYLGVLECYVGCG